MRLLVHVHVLALMAADAEPVSDGATSIRIRQFVSTWCRRNRETPEPAVLFYNRIPKAGSTSMLDITRAQARQMAPPTTQGGAPHAITVVIHDHDSKFRAVLRNHTALRARVARELGTTNSTLSASLSGMPLARAYSLSFCGGWDWTDLAE